MKIIRGDKGEIVMVIVSNSSGNYKPGIGSTIGLINKLEKIGVPSRRIALTSVLPGEPVLLKLLLKSKKKYGKDELKKLVSSARTRAKTVSANRLKAASSVSRMLADSSSNRAKQTSRTRGSSRRKHATRKKARKAKSRPKARARR
jgi:hypothetical protein